MLCRVSGTGSAARLVPLTRHKSSPFSFQGCSQKTLAPLAILRGR